MATIQVHCIECGGEKIIKQGTTPQGKQRYHCQDEGYPLKPGHFYKTEMQFF
jgi:transposase-like protein